VLIHAVSPPTQPGTLSAHRQHNLHCSAAFHCANIHFSTKTRSLTHYLTRATCFVRACACLLSHSRVCTKRQCTSVTSHCCLSRCGALCLTHVHAPAITHWSSLFRPFPHGLYLTHVHAPTQHAPLLHHIIDCLTRSAAAPHVRMLDCISSTCTHPHTLLCCTT